MGDTRFKATHDERSRRRRTDQTKSIFLFEKEKGGVGSTGTLVTVHHYLWRHGITPILIEADGTQADMAVPYEHRFTVLDLDLQSPDVPLTFLNMIGTIAPGAYVLVNIPGSSGQQLEQIHDYLLAAASHPECDLDTTIIWTMGPDSSSATTLESMLDGSCPGRVLLNMPDWGGSIDKYRHVTKKLVEKVHETGGGEFRCPTLVAALYDKFRIEDVGLDTIADEDLPLGTRIAFGRWKHEVDKRFKGLFI